MRFEDMVFVYHLQDEAQIAWHGRLHHHGRDLYELHFFLQGAGRFRNGPGEHAIGPCSLHFTPPGMDHQIIATDIQRPITYYAMLVDAAEDPPLLALLDAFSRGAARPHLLEDGYRLFFLKLMERHGTGHPDLVKAAQHEFQAFLYSLSAQEKGSPLRRGNPHVDRALGIMQDSLGKPMDLGSLCGRVGISREHLVRLFTEQMGVPPMQYYTRLKMDAARAMLSSTGLQIQEIAERLDFENPFNFTRAFRRATGLSPTAYRRHAGT